MKNPQFYTQSVRNQVLVIAKVLPGAVRRHAGYLSGGKMLRSSLLRETAEALGQGLEQTLLPAAILELVHTTTILHDDVIDRAEDRRGKATVNARLQPGAAVFAADLLLSACMSSLSRASARGGASWKGLEGAFHRKIREVCDGEIRQDLRLDSHEAPEDGPLLDIARDKTGALFALACMTPGYLLSLTATEVEWLEKAGETYGTVFQLVDDLDDLEFDTRFPEDGTFRFKHWTFANAWWCREETGSFRSFCEGRLETVPDPVREGIEAHVADRVRRFEAELLERMPKALSPVGDIVRGHLARLSLRIGARPPALAQADVG